MSSTSNDLSPTTSETLPPHNSREIMASRLFAQLGGLIESCSEYQDLFPSSSDLLGTFVSTVLLKLPTSPEQVQEFMRTVQVVDDASSHSESLGEAETPAGSDHDQPTNSAATASSSSLPDPGAASGSTSTAPQASGSTSGPTGAAAAPLPSLGNRAIRRSGAFYDRSHPHIFWHNSWGLRPRRPLKRQGATMDITLGMPPAIPPTFAPIQIFAPVPAPVAAAPLPLPTLPPTPPSSSCSPTLKRVHDDIEDDESSTTNAIASSSRSAEATPSPPKKQKRDHSPDENSPIASSSTLLPGRIRLSPKLVLSFSGPSTPSAATPPSVSSGKGKKRVREEVKEEDAAAITLVKGEEDSETTTEDVRPMRRLKLRHTPDLSTQPEVSSVSFPRRSLSADPAPEDAQSTPSSHRRVTRSSASRLTAAAPAPSRPASPMEHKSKAKGKGKAKATDSASGASSTESGATKGSKGKAKGKPTSSTSSSKKSPSK